MKYLMFVCESLADDPVADLSGRTPIEAAKTPVMDRLAKSGQVGRVSFVPGDLKPRGDVACLSALGYDPHEFYTGIGPLDALALGVDADDRDVLFRCDLVTSLDDTLVDYAAGQIRASESGILIEALNQKLSGSNARFYHGRGHRNILAFSDAALAEDLGGLECEPPLEVIGKSWKRHLPKGARAKFIADFIDEAKMLLDTHEINRVRIDLGENPANLIWLWGQGRKPKLPGFGQKFGKRGLLYSTARFAQGLGKAAGLEVCSEPGAIEDNLLFVYRADDEKTRSEKGLKRKIKRIEDFDIFLGKTLAAAGEGVKVCVTTDTPETFSKRVRSHGHVPFLVSGPGVAADEADSLNERIASQSRLVFDEGHHLMEFFLGERH